MRARVSALAGIVSAVVVVAATVVAADDFQVGAVSQRHVGDVGLLELVRS